ncbi:hypothetical protein BDZ89DRAFT_1132913 [Hymenopellis radicata]|nr:hypothetical protein BDZ89DRAFT_1132913 [Hymenopellis radicata]
MSGPTTPNSDQALFGVVILTLLPPPSLVPSLPSSLISPSLVCWLVSQLHKPLPCQGKPHNLYRHRRRLGQPVPRNVTIWTDSTRARPRRVNAVPSADGQHCTSHEILCSHDYPSMGLHKARLTVGPWCWHKIVCNSLSHVRHHFHKDDDCPLDETTLMTPAHNTPTYYLPSEFNNWASDDIPDRNSNDGAMGKRRRQTATEPRTAVDGDSEDEDTYNEAGHAYETEHVSDDADKHDFDEHDRKDENDHDGTG